MIFIIYTNNLRANKNNKKSRKMKEKTEVFLLISLKFPITVNCIL